MDTVVARISGRSGRRGAVRAAAILMAGCCAMFHGADVAGVEPSPAALFTFADGDTFHGTIVGATSNAWSVVPEKSIGRTPVEVAVIRLRRISFCRTGMPARAPNGIAAVYPANGDKIFAEDISLDGGVMRLRTPRGDRLTIARGRVREVDMRETSTTPIYVFDGDLDGWKGSLRSRTVVSRTGRAEYIGLGCQENVERHFGNMPDRIDVRYEMTWSMGTPRYMLEVFKEGTGVDPLNGGIGLFFRNETVYMMTGDISRVYSDDGESPPNTVTHTRCGLKDGFATVGHRVRVLADRKAKSLMLMVDGAVVLARSRIPIDDEDLANGIGFRDVYSGSCRIRSLEILPWDGHLPEEDRPEEEAGMDAIGLAGGETARGRCSRIQDGTAWVESADGGGEAGAVAASRKIGLSSIARITFGDVGRGGEADMAHAFVWLVTGERISGSIVSAGDISERVEKGAGWDGAGVPPAENAASLTLQSEFGRISVPLTMVKTMEFRAVPKEGGRRTEPERREE